MTSTHEATRISKPRWYMPTPGKFVALLLLSVVILYLSDQYDWFAFNKQKGWTVLIAIAFVAAGLMFLAAWAAVAYLVGRKAQVGLATLLFTIGVIALPLAWLAREVQQARQLSDDVKRLEQAGGKVEFAYYSLKTRNNVCSYGTTPAWLRKVLGDEFFGEDCAVTFDGPVDFAILREFKQLREVITKDKTVKDEDLAELSNLSQLESIYISSSEITDTALPKLLKMPVLKFILIGESHITDRGRETFEKNFAGQCLILPSFIALQRKLEAMTQELDAMISRNTERLRELEALSSQETDLKSRFDDPYSLEYRLPPIPGGLLEKLKPPPSKRFPGGPIDLPSYGLPEAKPAEAPMPNTDAISDGAPPPPRPLAKESGPMPRTTIHDLNVPG